MRAGRQRTTESGASRSLKRSRAESTLSRWPTLGGSNRLGYIPTTMFPLRSPRLTISCTLVLALASTSCKPSAQADLPAPAAEFLVTAGDSTFWVTRADGKFRIRRAPLTVAKIDGRFYELYVADDDRSYFDALFVAQRIFRRDLLSGDSLQVFEDLRVSGIARAYAAAHPSERPLKGDEDGSDDPHTVATSEAEMLDVVGPLLSFAHHIDIDIVNAEDTHLVQHGVIDLRDGQRVTLSGVFGDSVGRRIVSEGRVAYRAVIDSVRRSGGQGTDHASRTIDSFKFDTASFAIEEIDGAPMVGFHVPGAGPNTAGLALPLPHVRAPEPSWWAQIAVTVPKLGADSLSEIWGGKPYDVLARYDSSGEFATIVVRDSAQNEWNAGRVPTPARRVYRLDLPAVDSSTRRALARAFDEATLYSGTARSVSGPARRTPVVTLVSRPIRQPVAARSQSSHRTARIDRH